MSGTRLRARIGTTADGARTFLGWRDTSRNENCVFRTAEDGRIRCVPDTVATVSIYFEGTGCGGQPLGVVSWPDTKCLSTDPVYAIGSTVASCGNNDAVWTITGRYSGSIYMQQNGGICSLVTFSDNSQIAFRLGTKVSASSFVERVDTIE